MNSFFPEQFSSSDRSLSSPPRTLAWTTAEQPSTVQGLAGAARFKVRPEVSLQSASTIPLCEYSSFEEACLQNRVEQEIRTANQIAGQLHVLQAESAAVKNYIKMINETFLPFQGVTSIKSHHALTHIFHSLVAARIALLDAINHYPSWLSLAKSIEVDADSLRIPSRFVVQDQEDEGAEIVDISSELPREARLFFEEL